MDLVATGATDEDLYDLSGRLRHELLEADVVDVRRLRTGDPPPGARAVDAQAFASLVMTVSTSAATLHSVISGMRRWLGGGRDRKIVLSLDGDELEISGASDQEQGALIQLWIDRHVDDGH